MCMAIACCCLTGVCECCCCTINCLGSRIARLTYTVGLLIVSILAWALRNWGDQIVPQQYQNCPGDCFNYLAVYRVSMAFVLYHTGLCLFTIGVTTSKYPRAQFHNGWWPLKICILGGLMVGCFYVPEDFFPAYAIMSIIGGILFLIIQTVLILDFAYIWAESWVEYYDQNPGSLWRTALIGTTVICYCIVIAVSIVLIVFYALPGDAYQGLNIFFITFNLVLVLVCSIGAVLPAVQEANPRSGLLQAAIIGAYITYVTASSISSQPTDNDSCVPDSSDVFSQILFYLGFGSTFAALCINAFSTTTSDKELSVSADNYLNDEEDGTAYKYWFLHLVMVLAGFYMAALLTNWATFSEDAVSSGADFCVDEGIGAMWSKIATAWVIAILYLWTLIAPIVMPDRFGNN